MDKNKKEINRNSSYIMGVHELFMKEGILLDFNEFYKGKEFEAYEFLGAMSGKQVPCSGPLRRPQKKLL